MLFSGNPEGLSGGSISSTGSASGTSSAGGAVLVLSEDRLGMFGAKALEAGDSARSGFAAAAAAAAWEACRRSRRAAIADFGVSSSVLGGLDDARPLPLVARRIRVLCSVVRLGSSSVSTSLSVELMSRGAFGDVGDVVSGCISTALWLVAPNTAVRGCGI